MIYIGRYEHMYANQADAAAPPRPPRYPPLPPAPPLPRLDPLVGGAVPPVPKIGLGGLAIIPGGKPLVLVCD